MKKKLVSLMLVAAMTASLTACGSKKTEEPTSTVHKSITAAEYDAAITSDAAIYKKAFTRSDIKLPEPIVYVVSVAVPPENASPSSLPE